MTLYWGRRKYITSCGDIYMMSILRLTWRLVNKYCISCYNNSYVSCYFFDRKYENKYKLNVNTKWYIYLMVCCYFTIVSETEPWASNVESDYTDLVSTNCCRGNQFTLPLERFFFIQFTLFLRNYLLLAQESDHSCLWILLSTIILALVCFCTDIFNLFSQSEILNLSLNRFLP